MSEAHGSPTGGEHGPAPMPPPAAPRGRPPEEARVPQRGDWSARPELSPVPPDPPAFPDFPLLRTERCYDSPWCALRRDIIELPGGLEQEYHVYEISNAACVVPVLPDGSIVLIGQHRHPHGRTHWEIPAGRIGHGESPEETIHRELREETGYQAGRLIALPGFYPTNGISAHYAHVFAAIDCLQVGAPQLEGSEQLIVQTFRADEVRTLLQAGRIQDGFAAIALLYWLSFG